jgi:hypothetical protein
MTGTRMEPVSDQHALVVRNKFVYTPSRGCIFNACSGILIND